MTIQLPPPAAWPWRLPVIRHVRAIVAQWRMEQHYEDFRTLGMLPTYREQDEAIIEAIWKGEI